LPIALSVGKSGIESATISLGSARRNETCSVQNPYSAPSKTQEVGRNL